MCATSMSRSTSSRRSGCATRSLPQNSRLPSRVGFDSRRRATGRGEEREAEHPQHRRHPSRHSWRCADERQPRDAIRRLERECDRPQPAHRVPRDVDRIELERVEDLAQEHDRVVEDVDAVVVERVGQPVPRAIDGEYAVPAGERLEDRHPLECCVPAAVDEQERRPVAELEHLGLTLRPGRRAEPVSRARTWASSAACASSACRVCASSGLVGALRTVAAVMPRPPPARGSP